ncbi:hypothetical protein LIX60_14950 [Streptomyces sp. S07_1.15]|uniref:hypothetical protein n=1 Tax=Streptomyces sp. S07_1.15 TaxID=2873925 RepID=UPI001D150096|nr:hypothetical protein [Streptomyces sp. S07_1.15]MCC3652737.1 hypothetical protein [Streptomyces sp. S07_1.15]
MTNPETPASSGDPEEVFIRADARPGAALNAAEGDVVATFECRPSTGEWAATGDVARHAQGLVISRLELSATDPAGNGITGSLLRRVQISDVLHVARAHVALSVYGGPEQQAGPQEKSKSRSGGRAGLSDELLRSVAVAYLAETAPGRPAGAVKRIAEEFGRPDETIRSWIARARKAGWLGPSVKGRAGAEPGPRLRNLTPEEFARIFSEAYPTPPESLAELAAGFESMPKERAQAASVAWLTRERMAEHNRAALEWDRQEQEQQEQRESGEGEKE